MVLLRSACGSKINRMAFKAVFVQGSAAVLPRTSRTGVCMECGALGVGHGAWGVWYVAWVQGSPHARGGLPAVS